MGYRHTLRIIEKEKVNNLTEEQLEIAEESRYKLLEEILNMEEILDLGKYSDEGFELCKNHALKVDGIRLKLRNACFYEGDTQFEFLDPSALKWLAEKYHERTVNYHEKLLSDTEPLETFSKVLKTKEEKCVDYVEDLLHWKEFLINTDLENKYEVQTSWKYEYALYSIIHCYKMIKWDKYYLVITGG